MRPHVALPCLATLCALLISAAGCAADGAPATALATNKAQAMTTTKLITTTAELEPSQGARVRVQGIAQDAKLGAVVEGVTVFYCEGIEAWPDNVRNQQVVVEGELERTDQHQATQDEHGAWSQGTAGAIWVIKRPRLVR